MLLKRKKVPLTTGVHEKIRRLPLDTGQSYIFARPLPWYESVYADNHLHLDCRAGGDRFKAFISYWVA